MPQGAAAGPAASVGPSGAHGPGASVIGTAAASAREQRAEALARFREKRANRSFAKKIRYESRKQARVAPP